MRPQDSGSTDKVVWMDLHYLPAFAYFVRLLPYSTIRLDPYALYQRQTYYNRCHVLTSQGVSRLTVPVHHSRQKLPYNSVKITYGEKWVQSHWRTLHTAYGKAPYFHYFSAHFHAIFAQGHTYLFDLNLALLKTCLELLQLEKTIEIASEHEKTPNNQVQVVDARYSARSWQQDDCVVSYPQVFGPILQPNLSIIDLLFCTGREAFSFLQYAQKSKTNSVYNKLG